MCDKVVDNSTEKYYNTDKTVSEFKLIQKLKIRLEFLQIFHI